MRKLLFLFPIALAINCSIQNPNKGSLENVSISVKDLKRAYLDTTESGVNLEIVYNDPWIEERDSVQFYIGEVNQDFNPVSGFQGIYLEKHSDKILRKVIHIPFDKSNTPRGVVYEVGDVYLNRPVLNETAEWKQDTIINVYFAFYVYDDPKDYKQSVDSFGLKPTVFIRE
jgi:hypothetical protein